MTIPTDVAGCKLWLRADSLSLNHNDPVGTWNDESGNNFNAVQTNGTYQPTYIANFVNGLPAVYNTGLTTVRKGMLLTGMNVTSGSKTFFFVCQPISVAAYEYLFDTEVGRLIITSITETAAKVGWYDGSWHSVASSSSNFQILCYVLTSGGNGEIFRANSSIGTAAYTAKAIGSAVGLMQSYDEFGAYFAGIVAEAIAYDSALGSADRTSIYDYLYNKYYVAPPVSQTNSRKNLLGVGL